MAGALARHAEATLERIGAERQGMVREVFRNLVTSQGTRAACDREELLSVFPDRKAAEEVLGQLVAARLLTSYEEMSLARAPPGDARGIRPRAPGPWATHRIEIVHESLLRSWLRLVRWQAQDAEGSLLRDQLKQAAHLWDEKGRPADLLWSGTSFREYALWRERYPGKLTAVEEAFAKAMAGKARRRRRVLTAAMAVSLLVLLGVAGAIAVSRQAAVAARSRAEAARLVALGRVELDRYPTAALAYARKSLETADNAEARRLAVEALWRAPSSRILALSGNPSWRAAFSPDGRRFAASTFSEYVLLHDEDGAPARKLGGFVRPAGPAPIAFAPGGDTLVTGWWENTSHRGVQLRLREVSVLDGRERRWVEADDPGMRMSNWAPTPEGMLVFSEGESDVVQHDLVPWDGSVRRRVGTAHRAIDFTPAGNHFFLLRERSVFVRPLNGSAATPERPVATVPPGKPLGVRVTPRGELVVTLQDSQGLYLALFPSDSTSESRPRLFRVASPDSQFPPAFDAGGSRLVWGSSGSKAVSLWDLDGPPDVEPLVLRRPVVDWVKQGVFSPRGDWLAVANHESFAFWATSQPWVRILRRHTDAITNLQFKPDSSALVSCAMDGLGVWPMAARGGSGAIRSGPETAYCEGLAISADGRQTAWVQPVAVHLGSSAGGREAARLLHYQEGTPEANCWGAALDPSGNRLAVGATYARQAQDLVLRVFDLATGSQRAIPLVPPGEAFTGYEWSALSLAFTPEGKLLVGGPEGIRRFDPDTGASEWLRRADARADVSLKLTPDGRTAFAVLNPWDTKGTEPRRLIALDLVTRQEREIASHGQRLTSVAISPSGSQLVTGDQQGVVRVGTIEGGEPHLLLGHAGSVSTVAVSPDGQWIASASGTEIRLWPMPDLAKPPFHTLPYDVLMARLDRLTNVRVVEDETSPTSYRLDVGPFPGWKDVPAW